MYPERVRCGSRWLWAAIIATYCAFLVLGGVVSGQTAPSLGWLNELAVTIPDDPLGNVNYALPWVDADSGGYYRLLIDHGGDTYELGVFGDGDDNAWVAGPSYVMFADALSGSPGAGWVITAWDGEEWTLEEDFSEGGFGSYAPSYVSGAAAVPEVGSGLMASFFWLLLSMYRRRSAGPRLLW